jgi:predicted secreted protein
VSNPTSNFGWQMPTPTDLVTDLPADFEVFGQAVDTSLADLKGGTTGQILSKTTNADMDFTWIANDQGDITEITATSPLTGGGTSGAITVGIQASSTTQSGAVQLEDSTASTSTTKAATPNSVKSAYDLANAAIPKSLVDAKADIITATADNTPARLAVGANNTVLTADSSTATGLKWATPSGGGKVLQVVQATTTSTVTSTSTTFADSNLSATITPSATSSKILVITSQYIRIFRTGASQEASWQLLRGATALLTYDYQSLNGIMALQVASNTASNLSMNGIVPMAYLDSPSTTSAITYKTQIATASTSSSGSVAAQYNGLTSTIILMEIGA